MRGYLPLFGGKLGQLEQLFALPCVEFVVGVEAFDSLCVANQNCFEPFLGGLLSMETDDPGVAVFTSSKQTGSTKVGLSKFAPFKMGRIMLHNIGSVRSSGLRR